MKDFILEIYSEEIPASMQESASGELFLQLSKSFNESNISFGKHLLMSSPRRIAVVIHDIPESLAANIQEFKGPKQDAPIQAIEGFAKNHEIEVAQLELKNIKDVPTYFYYKKIPAELTSNILAAILPQVLKNINWQKSQKWDDSEIRWIRPIRSILCLLGSEVIKFNFGNITASNYTFGHRFMKPEKFLVADTADYIEALNDRKVICFAEQRKQNICAQIATITAKNNLTLIEDNVLLNEVNGLVEYPNALLGQIEERYMDLPPEVLITSMRHHQKIFCLNNNQGKLSNKFITIANVATQNDALIIEGNQKVVGARLADAKFFWAEDCKKNLQEHAANLARVVFHKEIGSMAEKTTRIAKIAKFIASKYIACDENLILRAASIIKADLVTEMVGEFPELQGTIGKYYAEFYKENSEVAQSIEEHYRPITQHDKSPTNNLSIIMSLADKVDSLVGLWIAGEKPTGSKDPYALRRSALAIIKLVLDSNITSDLKELIIFASDLFTSYVKFDSIKIQQEIEEFIATRLKQYFKNNSFRNDVIETFVTTDLNICKISEKISICSNFIVSDAGKKAIYSIKRVLNILELNQEDINASVDINETLLTHGQEIDLYKKLFELKAISQQIASNDLIAKSFEFITILSPLIDNFFDHVIVNDQDILVRTNRLILLKKIKNQVTKLGDFSKLEV